jgi:integrase
MPKITTHDPAAVGIYRHGKNYYLRHTVDGEQQFDNLHVRFVEAPAEAKAKAFADAIVAASKVRGKPRPGSGKKTPWKSSISKYISDKLAGVKPSHMAGKRSGSFSESTADRTRGIIEVFARESGAPTPQQVTIKHLQKYYDARRTKSEASAQTCVNRVQSFLEHLNCCPGKVIFPVNATKERRNVTVAIDGSNAMIESAPTDKLRYILFAGFHAGLRKNEIIQSRPQWFDLSRRVLSVPGKEDQRQANGKIYKWRAKNMETRDIPLSVEFTAFLQGFLKRGDLFVLEPDKCFRKARYRYDPRRIFANFVEKMGRGDAFYHAMRHSFISALCNSGNHTITEVSAWSGDTIEVIEKNYWHRTTTTGGLDATMSGRRLADQQRTQAESVAEILKLLKEGKTEEARKELEVMYEPPRIDWPPGIILKDLVPLKLY